MLDNADVNRRLILELLTSNGQDKPDGYYSYLATYTWLFNLFHFVFVNWC